METIKDIKRLVLETAPHGSGIDFDYRNCIRDPHGYISFENAYHLMDENGYYDDIIPFKIKIDKYGEVKVIFQSLSPNQWYKVRYKYDWLREYLIEEYYNWTQQAIVRYSIEEIFSPKKRGRKPLTK